MNFLIPLIAFVAVVLTLMLGYGMWAYFFDPEKKAKKQRLDTIQNTIQPDRESFSNTRTTRVDSFLEIWLRPRSGIFRQLENLIERAHIPQSAIRIIGIMLALFLGALVLGLLLHTNPLLLLLLASAIASAPVLWLILQANKRTQAFENKLPEMLDFISRALRAGHSLTSALAEVGKEFPDPIGPELKTVSDEMAFGLPFKDALFRLAERVQSNDLSFFVTSLMIQHETGGNLSELLDGLANTIRERFKLRGKVRTLSSEGRASAWILGCMPFALAAIISVLNPQYMSLLWTTPQGKNLIYTCLGLMTFGVIVINKIIRIKV